MDNNENKTGIEKILLITVPAVLGLLTIAGIVILVLFSQKRVTATVVVTPTGSAQGGMMQMVNPYTYYDNADAFREKLGIELDVPEGCEADQYIIISGQIADVRFTSSGHEYTLRAAKTEDSSVPITLNDISGIMGTEKRKEKLASKDAVLSVIGTEEESFYKISWTAAGVQYSLGNTDGASEEEVKELFEKIK
ncbi:MAG: hypothetical protein J6U42_05845 [Lachnospiraceae bacterium]|nr:hypothetical protein [Lachnospiraceae bacterium]